MECQYCKKVISTAYKLKIHQETTKYCLKIQGVSPEPLFLCKYCNKEFIMKSVYDRHVTSHTSNEKFMKYQQELDELRDKIRNLESIIEIKELEIKSLRENIEEKDKSFKLQTEVISKNTKIQYLTKKYVKAQERVNYEERNVIYVLTNNNMKNDRRYIIGKTKNLTSRLSVYNKSEEHEVVYYQECPDEDKMGVVERLVFSKLQEYREQANRERFILPEDRDINLFVDVIKECIEFVK